MRLKRRVGLGAWASPARRRPPRWDARPEVWRAAEGRAAGHLVEEGYEIIERNWRDRRGELDIVATRGDVLAVVEVRGLADAYWVRPEETVDHTKQTRVFLAARRWLAAHPGVADRFYVRFDVIGVVVATGELRHIESAFGADDVGRFSR